MIIERSSKFSKKIWSWIWFSNFITWEILWRCCGRHSQHSQKWWVLREPYMWDLPIMWVLRHRRQHHTRISLITLIWRFSPYFQIKHHIYGRYWINWSWMFFDLIFDLLFQGFEDLIMLFGDRGPWFRIKRLIWDGSSEEHVNSTDNVLNLCKNNLNVVRTPWDNFLWSLPSSLELLKSYFSSFDMHLYLQTHMRALGFKWHDFISHLKMSPTLHIWWTWHLSIFYSTKISTF